MKKIPGFLPVKSVSWDKQILENSGFFKKKQDQKSACCIKISRMPCENSTHAPFLEILSYRI